MKTLLQFHERLNYREPLYFCPKRDLAVIAVASALMGFVMGMWLAGSIMG